MFRPSDSSVDWDVTGCAETGTTTEVRCGVFITATLRLTGGNERDVISASGLPYGVTIDGGGGHDTLTASPATAFASSWTAERATTARAVISSTISSIARRRT